MAIPEYILKEIFNGKNTIELTVEELAKIFLTTEAAMKAEAKSAAEALSSKVTDKEFDNLMEKVRLCQAAATQRLIESMAGKLLAIASKEQLDTLQIAYDVALDEFDWAYIVDACKMRYAPATPSVPVEEGEDFKN